MAIRSGKKKVSKTAKMPEPDIPSLVLPFLDRAAEAADVTLHSDDPEGPHQIRVGLRKLRTALSVFARGESEAKMLAAEAREVASIVGDLRDLDVVRDEILAPFLRQHPGASGFEGLNKALQAQTDDSRARVRAMLETGRLDAILREARGWLADYVGRPASKAANRSLRRRFRKAKHYGWQFMALDTEQRHVFRKELKKVRYSLDCGAWPEGGKQKRAFQKKLKALQETLGSMNDAATADGILTAAAAQAGVAERAAAGQIIACLNARSGPELARTSDMWMSFEAAAPDWL